MSTKFYIFFTNFPLCLNILSSYQLASFKEDFFSNNKFCLLLNFFLLWQKHFSLQIFFFFLWHKRVSLTETWTKTCFCDGNLFSKGNCFSDRNFCLKETSFYDINFFLWRIFSVTESFCITKTFSVTENCSVKNTLFLGFYPWFSGKSFREKWDFPLSWITKITTSWSPGKDHDEQGGKASTWCSGWWSLCRASASLYGGRPQDCEPGWRAPCPCPSCPRPPPHPPAPGSRPCRGRGVNSCQVASSRGQGAGSRGQGAASREQWAGSHLCG